MGLFKRRKSLLPGANRSVRQTTYPVSRFATASYGQVYAGQPNVRAVVSFLGNSLASIPLHVYMKRGEARQELSLGHPLVRLLRKPNPRQTGFELRRDVWNDYLIYGNSYTVIVRADDRPVALVRVVPEAVSLVTDVDEVLSYRVQLGLGGELKFPAADVLHLKAYSPTDPTLGSSPLEALKDVLTEDDEARKFRKRVWEHGAQIVAAVEREVNAPDMSDEDITRFYEEFTFRGRDPQAAAVALLDEGMHYKDVDSSPPQGSNIREATMAEVCAVYNVPLQLVGQSDRNLGIAKELFLTETLPPYLTSLEDRLDQDLVPDFGDERIFTEHLLEQKLRGSWIEQSKMLAVIAGKDGFLTPNEARALLNLPPITGGDTLPPRS